MIFWKKKNKYNAIQHREEFLRAHTFQAGRKSEWGCHDNHSLHTLHAPLQPPHEHMYTHTHIILFKSEAGRWEMFVCDYCERVQIRSCFAHIEQRLISTLCVCVFVCMCVLISSCYCQLWLVSCRGCGGWREGSDRGSAPVAVAQRLTALPQVDAKSLVFIFLHFVALLNLIVGGFTSENNRPVSQLCRPWTQPVCTTKAALADGMRSGLAMSAGHKRFGNTYRHSRSSAGITSFQVIWFYCVSCLPGHWQTLSCPANSVSCATVDKTPTGQHSWWFVVCEIKHCPKPWAAEAPQHRSQHLSHDMMNSFFLLYHINSQ